MIIGQEFICPYRKKKGNGDCGKSEKSEASEDYYNFLQRKYNQISESMRWVSERKTERRQRVRKRKVDGERQIQTVKKRNEQREREKKRDEKKEKKFLYFDSFSCFYRVT